MNERIRELSRLAHSAGDSTYAEGPDAIWLRKYEKKFAELIIRECMDIVSKAGNSKAEILWNLEELIWSNK
jgi:hypothetical protein